MDPESRELLASITARLDAISMSMHDLARERNTLITAATRLRTGERRAVVLATLGSDWYTVRHASER